MSQNNWITCVLFSCRDGGWTGPDTCIRTYRGNAWFTTGVTQSFASPSKPPRTQPQLPQTFVVGVCRKLILHASCAANLLRYAMFLMVAQSHFTKDGTLGCITLFCPPSVTGWTPSGNSAAPSSPYKQPFRQRKKRGTFSSCAPVNASQPQITSRSANHLPPKPFFFKRMIGHFSTI